MVSEDNGIFGEVQSPFSMREWLINYLRNWPWFLVAILFTVSIGIFYIRNTVPQYMATTTFLIRGAEGGGSKSGDLIESALSGKGTINLNNEMRLIKSGKLMERTVAKNGFNVSYYIKGRILNSEVYNAIPFSLIAKQITDSNSVYSLHITKIYIMGGSFLYGSEKKQKSYSFHWNVPVTISGQTFVLAPKRVIGNEEVEYIINWLPPRVEAQKQSQNLTVSPVDTRSSLLQLSLKTENVEKGKDVLNALLAEFNLADIEDRNKIYESTVQFIDDRLLAISNELKGVEGNLESYQGSNQLIDIKAQTSQSLGNTEVGAKNVTDIAVKQGLADMILEYFNNPGNINKLVPSSIDLSDATLNLIVGQYNELQIKKQRETPMVAPNSTVMQDINSQLATLRASILETLDNIKKNLQFRETNMRQQNSQTKSFLSSVPHNERVMQEIKRKQSVTEGLYLYLLQKREEMAISSTGSNVIHYKQIDPAGGYGPVEPNTTNIIIYSALLGLILAAASVYLKDNILNDKINSREDITRKISIPLIGQISHISRKKKQVISVLGRSLAGEEFRAIRTQLSFLLKNKTEKVILVTSSLSNEGKSFTSLNLAAVCAIPGKKVALLEFDIRNPSIASGLQLESLHGLTDFLSGEVDALSEIAHTVGEIPTLHIYPSGSIAFNPADLLLSENITRLFQNLKKDYDYIIIDTPPVGLVSDAYLLNPYCEIVLYIVRQKVTQKSRLEIINDIRKSGNLKNIHLVLNDVETKGDKNYYAYGDGYDYKKNKNTLPKRKIFAGLFNF